MATMRGLISSVRDFVRACERFVRDYTAGLRAHDVRRLFDREAGQAYDVLARDQAGEPEPEDGFHRFWYRVKVVFLGLSYKLTPARRLLFAGSMVFFLIGLLDIDLWRGSAFRFSLSWLWFFLSVATLVFLLALELVDRIRVRDELEVARELQSDLLPRSIPDLKGYRIAHAYRTANEVGGDYYDISLLPDGRLAVLVGDASGHGMAAGLLMAIANATLKMAMDLDPEPAKVLSLLNLSLCRTGGKRAFMSLFYALLEPQSGFLTYCCAGHPFPYLRRAGGEIEELGTGGLPLGLRRDLEFSAQTTRIEPAELLVLFSDGIPEGVNRAGDSFGYDRLRDLVASGGSPRALHERILLAFDEYLEDEPLRDDFSLVVLGRSAAAEGATRVPPPPPPTTT
ncbi:MAG: SpoIIE family protein phosphatase [Acidobacteria bacterium]|nr:SpoIIE family protein phosphatase [Acidobacteriota bacterium]